MTGPSLIIQIPCFNDAANLGITLASLPRAVPGFAQVEWMIIDDGSTDQTIAVAKAAGVDHIVRLAHNQGSRTRSRRASRRPCAPAPTSSSTPTPTTSTGPKTSRSSPRRSLLARLTW